MIVVLLAASLIAGLSTAPPSENAEPHGGYFGCATFAPLVGAHAALEKARTILATSPEKIEERATLLRNADREVNRLDVKAGARCDEQLMLGLLGLNQEQRSIIEARTIVAALRYMRPSGGCQTLALARRRADIAGAYRSFALRHNSGVPGALNEWNSAIDVQLRAAADEAHVTLPDVADGAAIEQLDLIAESQVSAARATLTSSCGTSAKDASGHAATNTMLYGRPQ